MIDSSFRSMIAGGWVVLNPDVFVSARSRARAGKTALREYI